MNWPHLDNPTHLQKLLEDAVFDAVNKKSIGGIPKCSCSSDDLILFFFFFFIMLTAFWLL